MQKKFLTNLALLLFLNFLVKPFWIFGIDRTVQNTVGLVDYGFYFTIFNFAFLFNILLDAGITNFNNRNIAQHVHLLNKHFSSLVILKFLLTFIYVAVTFIVALIIGYKGEQLTMLAWVGFNQFLLSFILYLRSNVSGMLMFRTDSFLSVFDRVLMILICAALLWGNLTGGVFKIEWFVYAQTAAYLITMAVAMAIVVRKAKFKRLSWNWPFFLVILKKSLPFAILALLMSVYNRVDSVFIERLLEGAEGKRQVGIYAHAFRLLDAFNQFAWLFAVLLLPIYSKMIKMKQELNKMIRLPYSLLITSAIIVVTGSYFYRTEIMEWLYPRGELESAAEFADKLSQSARVYGILMFGFLGSTTMYVFSTLLTANGNLKQLNMIALGGIIVNFGINILLIPRMQASGAAYASLVTQLFTAGSYLIMAQYFFRFKIDYRFIFTLLFFIVLVIGFNFISKELSFHWLLSFSIMLTASLISAFTLRLINIVEIIRLLKEKSSV
ncbi:MAG: polysaccharide biosynthesis C-terminal domain-containing protein [Bacteroidales bacterium]|nr:polysaccharide biosynthesis C-terminal domain-containing protein [Bacteroidales bacterium]